MRPPALVSAMSYYPEDLALLSWNGAVLIDPEGSTVAVELIEFAKVELLLMRACDADLDARLPSMYQGIGRSAPPVRTPVRTTLRKQVARGAATDRGSN